jgi:hypothetical protein
MVSLKPISAEAIPFALERALRYRFLNEPLEAESICRDVLATDPGNSEALVTLLLSLTDQFDTEHAAALGRANEVLPQLQSAYDREYYEGIVNERWAKAVAARGVPSHIVASWFRQAMQCYERAEGHSTADNPDPALRWNTCARILKRWEEAEIETPHTMADVEAEAGDEVPHVAVHKAR